MAQPTVAMIGLGIMGSAMSGNLIRSRFQVLGMTWLRNDCARSSRKVAQPLGSQHNRRHLAAVG
jgi:3-hydroxyisobutyrate dehydrogenase-like beta-hydroxyacid dehydrogenase